MIDSHCHLDFNVFDDDVKDVLEEARMQGVSRFLIPGTTPQGWQIQLAYGAQFSQVDIAIGLHPYFPDVLTSANISALDNFITRHRSVICALGEIGLDKTVDLPLDEQEEYFHQQLSLAQKHALPVILHHRKTHHLLLKHLKSMKFKCGGVIHAFSGSEQIARAYIDMGFYLGIGGTITYERAKKTRATVAALPLSALLLETDSPDMPVCGYQGERNTPARITNVARALATLHQTTISTISRVTDENYCRLFRSVGKASARPSA